jgi:bifunctional non-homologous end joining protein LigD
MLDDVLPMLATSGEPPTGPGWVWELKWDGIRALVHLDDGQVRVRARSGRDVTERYPELAGLAVALAGRRAVLDGEIVASGDDGQPSFERLQRRMHVQDRVAIARLAHDVPVVYVAFDLLALDGQSLLARPWHERRAALESLRLEGPSWRTSPCARGEGDDLRAFARAHGMEGVIAKREDSIYVPGRRTRAWIKVKHARRQEFVVGGWVEGARGRAGTIGALVLGVYEPLDAPAEHRVLRCTGKVGSGFSNDDLARFEPVLARLARADSPFGAGTVPRGAHFVEPLLVVEVRFTEWTASGTVRQPSFLGVRADREPRTVVREPDVVSP